MTFGEPVGADDPGHGRGAGDPAVGPPTLLGDHRPKLPYLSPPTPTQAPTLPPQPPSPIVRTQPQLTLQP